MLKPPDRLDNLPPYIFGRIKSLALEAAASKLAGPKQFVPSKPS